MNAKLTLSLDQQVIEQAKIFAQKNQTSLSKMIEEYLAVVTSPYQRTSKSKSGIDALIGIVNDPGADISYDEIRYKALKKKYGL